MPDIDLTGIQNFYDVARIGDFSRDFQFRIIQLGSNEWDTELGPSKTVYMTTASIPNRAINNQTVPYMGLNFNVPGSVSYPGSEGWSVTFRMPQDYSIRDTLERWQITTFDDETSTGDYNIPGRDSVIELGLLNTAGNVIRFYTLYGVYVVNLGEVAYDITGSGAPMTFPATLAYQYWRQGSSIRASGGDTALTQATKIVPPAATA